MDVRRRSASAACDVVTRTVTSPQRQRHTEREATPSSGFDASRLPFAKTSTRVVPRAARPVTSPYDTCRGAGCSIAGGGRRRASRVTRANSSFARVKILAHLDLDAFFAAVEELEDPDAPRQAARRRRRPARPRRRVDRELRGADVRDPLCDERRRGASPLPAARSSSARGTRSTASTRASSGTRSARSSRASSAPGSTRATSTSAPWPTDFTRARAIASAIQTAVRATHEPDVLARRRHVEGRLQDRLRPAEAGRDHRRPARNRGRLSSRHSPVRLLPGVGPRAEAAAAQRRRRHDRRARGTRRPRAALAPPRLARPAAARSRAGHRRRATSISSSSPSPSRPRTRSRATSLDRERLHDEVRRLAELVSERLRNSGLSGRTVTAKLRYADFSIRTRSTTLPAAVDDAERDRRRRVRPARSRPPRPHRGAPARRRRSLGALALPAADARGVVESVGARGGVLGARHGRVALGRRDACRYARLSAALIGLAMAFGSGALIAAVAYELVIDAFETDLSARVDRLRRAAHLTFYVGDWADRPHGRGGTQEHDGRDTSSPGSASAIVLGTVLDGIPESFVLGASLLQEGVVPTSRSSSACSSRTFPSRSRDPQVYCRPAGPQVRVFGCGATSSPPRWLRPLLGYSVIDAIPPGVVHSRSRSPAARCSSCSRTR